MTPRIFVITPSLPERGELRTEAAESVEAQLLAPAGHLIGIDHARIGPGRMRNALAGAASAISGVESDVWLAFLDDDDTMDCGHLMALSEAFARADVVYSYFRKAGHAPECLQNVERFDPERLRAGNYIPVTVAIRLRAFHSVGGFRPPQGSEPDFEDWLLWLRLLKAGARFECIPRVTWTYRFHAGAQRSDPHGAAAGKALA